MSKPKKGISIEEYNLEKIRKIEVRDVTQNNVRIKATDLREILFRYNPNTEIKISNSILYSVLIQLGVRINGFTPNKTALRHTYGLSIEKINEILPGSYTSSEHDGRRKGNPRK